MSCLGRASCVLISILCCLVFAGCQTEYQQGYAKGVQDVREIRQQLGPVAEFGLPAAQALGMYPTDDTKSADWNAGYRAGSKAEAQQ